MSLFFNKLSKLSDEELLRMEPGRKVWSEFYERYAALSFGVCLKYLKSPEKAQDATSDIFVKLPELIRKSDIQNFKPWFHTVVRNHCLMMLRKKNHEDLYEDAQFAESIIDEGAEELLLTKEKLLNGLSVCLDTLKAEQKTCVELFYIESLSYQDIVDQTGIELKKVKSHIQNGKRNLKICLEKK